MTDWSTPRVSPVPLRPREVSLRERALDRTSPLRQLDWVLLLAVSVLVAVGGLLIWSATREKEIALGLDPQAFLKKHIINAVIGLALGCAAALIDYRSLRAYAPIVYGASCLGLLAVLSPLGSTINGAHSWIVLPAGFQIQPSEFAKLAIVVGMAMLLGEKRDGESGPRDGDVLTALALCALPMGLIMLQPDFGTTMVFIFVILGVLAVAGAPARWVVGLLVAGVLVGGFVAPHVLKDYQLDRFRVVANPTIDPSGVGYNTTQARVAIGAGGLWGKGLFQGSQTQGRFIPEQQTDFVFTVAGEELGLVGAGGIILVLGLVLWRGLRIASQATDPFGRLVAAGVVSWFAFQSFVNIGMTLGIMPVTGLPLPFVSYGGSAMFANLMAIGLLQNVHMTGREL
ncbi:MAG: rod shape-determining protein RodA [Frankiales bacterium]|nr:rod shape-determining protein RodA [Frankiales bacterium]MCW2586779.1 rod shape-determining protein RodA [Frankiales bacterium]